MSTAGAASTLKIRVRTKRFAPVGAAPPKLVIQNLELDVPQGQLIALFGPSGCGKTTLLNLIAGLDRDFEGRIAQLPGWRIGYVFQDPRLLPWLTVSDNLRLVLDEPPDADARIADWLAAMELAEQGEVFPNRLSLGMARRVALARAFIIKPDLLLMDEPFVSLDDPTAQGLRRVLIELWQRHRTTVLFVTHDRTEAVMLATRILRLGGGSATLVADCEVRLTSEARLDQSAVRDEVERIFGRC
jgi:NitT/TauT family transport system ATP-binding protein